MTLATSARPRRDIQSKRNGAHEMYVTYDIEEKARGLSNISPIVKPVYITGTLSDWKTGIARARTGQEVYGVMIKYELEQKGHRRRTYLVRSGKIIPIAPASVRRTKQTLSRMVEIPAAARNVQIYDDGDSMPIRYRHALQNVR